MEPTRTDTAMKSPDTTDAKSMLDYASEAGLYDEMWAADGQVHPHWTYLFESLQAMGGTELEGRRNEARQLLRENGVTYNIYDDPLGAARPWEFDPVPALFSSEEWSEVEAGLAQRAELLNLILTDLYGPQELIKKRIVPLELIYSHPGFLRPCMHVRQKGEHQLILHAADLARGPDGKMWVLGDRVQAPSGAGYALENRMVTSRIVPSLFRDCQVHRLALFFRAMRATFSAIAPAHSDDPQIVVLTPGPRNETYFEHAYLANYLGYSLVQGDNLTVSKGRVWMRSVGGLQPVDVILRRVDDHYCDPVELRGDSQLGVPGLLEVARRGNVAIANPLGSSVLENAGLTAFLPNIAQYFLGQPLQLPSVATWWCGQKKECDHVLKHLHRMVIKPNYRYPGSHSVFGAQLSKKDLARLKERIKSRPYMYIGQEQVGFSTTPSLVNGQLEPRQAVFRGFSVARDEGYVVMPGGLTRAAPERDRIAVSNQAGAISKDTWVLASEPEKQVTLWTQPSAAGVAASIGALPGRAADNLFWVGRYAERSEGMTRLLRTVINQVNENEEHQDATGSEVLGNLLRALTHLTKLYPGFIGEGAEERLKHPELHLMQIISDTESPNSLATTLRNFTQAAYTVRDRWSNDTWRVVDDIAEQAQRVASTTERMVSQAQDKLDDLITVLAAFSGLCGESMTRNHGWRFLDTGRRLERAMQLISLLRSLLVWRHEDLVEQLLLEDTLITSESLITYRRRYRSMLRIESVLDLLLFDASNPRSLVYQLERMQENIAVLPRERINHQLSREERLVLEAISQIRLTDADTLAQASEDGSIANELEQLLARLSHLLTSTSEAVTDAFFSHVEGPQPLERNSTEGHVQ